jgi:hypothetical protein
LREGFRLIGVASTAYTYIALISDDPRLAAMDTYRLFVYRDGQLIASAVVIDAGPFCRRATCELAGLSAHKAVEELNRHGIKSATGGVWYPATVLRLRESLA